MLRNLKKKIVKKIRNIRRIRTANELFITGKIFKAKKKELNNIIQEYTSTDSVINQKDMIRAFTTLLLKNNRYSNSLQNLNIFLSLLIIVLTIFSLRLSKEQRDYTELSTRADRIEQHISIRNALEYCKQNPTAVDSGLQGTDSGKTASCAEALNNKNFDKYKD